MRIRWLGCLYGLAALLAGCAVERAGGELGVGACSDRRDNDDDQAIDCEDPDCQAESVCGRAAPLREPDDEPARPAPPATAADAGGSIGSPLGPTADAGTVEPPEMVPDPSNPPDAAVDPTDPTMCPVCGADESCIEGVCVPNQAVFVELWDITRITGAFPRGFDAGTCVDVSCGLGNPPLPVFPLCRCQPEPLVRVSVKRPGEKAEVVAETPFDPLNQRSDDGDWEVSKQLELRPEYEITLTALDRNGIFEQVLFACTMLADPELLGSGTLSCEHTFTGSRGMTFVGKISVSIQPSTGSIVVP